MIPANKKYLCPICANRNPIGAVKIERAFSNVDHHMALKEEKCDVKKIQDYSNEAKFKGIVKDLKENDCHLILQAKIIGSWMTVWVNTVTNTVLAATELRDFVCARYDITSSNSPQKPDA